MEWIKGALAEARAFADRTNLNLTIDLYATQEESYSPAGSPSLSGTSAPSSLNYDSDNKATFPGGASTPASLDDDKKADLAAPSLGAETLGRASLHYVRPDASFVVSEFLEQGKGQRNMVLACGPTGLGDAIRLAGGRHASALDEVHVASFDC